MTDEQILELARVAYEERGLEPTQWEWFAFTYSGKPVCACVLGAAAFALDGRHLGTGHDEEDDMREACEVFGRTDAWVSGCIHGFDGVAVRQAEPDYLAGHAFGRRARVAFLHQPAEPAR